MGGNDTYTQQEVELIHEEAEQADRMAIFFHMQYLCSWVGKLTALVINGTPMLGYITVLFSSKTR